MKKLRSLLIIPLLLILVVSLCAGSVLVAASPEVELDQPVVSPAPAPTEEISPAPAGMLVLADPVSAMDMLVSSDPGPMISELDPSLMVVGLTSSTSMSVLDFRQSSYIKIIEIEHLLSSGPSFWCPLKFPC